MVSFRQVTLSNGIVIHINPEHVMFVGMAYKDGAPIVNQSALKMIDGTLIVEGVPTDVVMTLGGE